MNFAKVFQIDIGHQLLVTIPPYCEGDTYDLSFCTAIAGDTITQMICYEDSEDLRDLMFDEMNDEFALEMYNKLKRMYEERMRGLN